LLRKVVLLLTRWYIFGFISGDEDDTISLRARSSRLEWLILEGLDVCKTVEEPVCGASHDDFLWILFSGHINSLQLFVLLFRVCLEPEVGAEVVLLSTDQAHVSRFECFLVRFKTFDKLVSFFFFFTASKHAEYFEEDVGTLTKEDDNRCSVVRHFHWVCVCHCLLDAMTR